MEEGTLYETLYESDLYYYTSKVEILFAEAKHNKYDTSKHIRKWYKPVFDNTIWANEDYKK